LGSSVEIDVATFARDNPDVPSSPEPADSDGQGAWQASQPTLALAADLLAMDEYAVRVYDMRRGRRLVAAVEIVSPSNKDRPDHRQAFVAKCAALLQERVSVAIVDLVTSRHFDLFREMLTLVGQWPSVPSSPVYAAACRGTKRKDDWFLEAWFHALEIGRPLPILPLWLADDLAIPLDLESSYEATCRILRLP
jgi:hypothetical protein